MRRCQASGYASTSRSAFMVSTRKAFPSPWTWASYHLMASSSSAAAKLRNLIVTTNDIWQVRPTGRWIEFHRGDTPLSDLLLPEPKPHQRMNLAYPSCQEAVLQVRDDLPGREFLPQATIFWLRRSYSLRAHLTANSLTRIVVCCTGVVPLPDMPLEELRADIRAGIVDAVLEAGDDHALAGHVEILEDLFRFKRGAGGDHRIGGAVHERDRRL